MTNAQRGLKAGDISEYIRLIERLYGVKVWYTPEYISNDWVPPMIISLERAGSATFADQLKDIVDAYNDFGPYVNGETSQGMYTPIAALLGTNIYLSGMRIFPQIIMDDMLMLCMSSVVILLGVYVYGAVRAGITKLMSKGE